MIDFHTWATPNGVKVHIMLEETGLAYRLRPVSLPAGAQRDPAFLRLNPNGKIPVIVDHDGPGGRGVTVAESGAILIYLAEKTGALLPPDPVARTAAIQWIMFQMSAIGPVFGQLHHFSGSAPERIDYAIERFGTEALRLLGVLETRLAGSRCLAGDDFSVADVCTWPWIRSFVHTLGRELSPFPSIRRWYGEIEQRPSVGIAVEAYLGLRGGRPA